MKKTWHSRAQALQSFVDTVIIAWKTGAINKQYSVIDAKFVQYLESFGNAYPFLAESKIPKPGGILCIAAKAKACYSAIMAGSTAPMSQLQPMGRSAPTG